MTAGIDVRHINDFDLDEYHNENHDPKAVYVIEWHDSVKMPLGGWKCYQAMVIDVSKSIKTLEKKLEALEGVKSPGPSVKPVEVLEQTDFSEDIEVVKTLTTENPKKTLRFSDDIKNIKTSDKEVAIIKEIPYGDLNSAKEQPGEGSTSNHQLGDSNKEALYEDKLKANKRPSNFHLPPSGDPKKCKPVKSAKMKELGHEGSGVWITRDQWDEAKRKNSFTAMTGSLLSSVFPVDVLLKSNYKGGSSKNTEFKDKKYKALDEKLLRVIRETVQEKHKDFKDGPFGTAVNNKCGKVRNEMKKQKLKAEKLLEEAARND
ncbi:hypothetical protein KQX54_010295 [Cotesia glomerata]|uniref:BEN domain-containing protein n=1 Tax=Cotesia glomerata TaxID=32391 RepID=A0AAV7HYX5_COTGL|nr:hypothetical protein KQX54_010295 [Cotesia glomerata]